MSKAVHIISQAGFAALLFSREPHLVEFVAVYEDGKKVRTTLTPGTRILNIEPSQQTVGEYEVTAQSPGNSRPGTRTYIVI